MFLLVFGFGALCGIVAGVVLMRLDRFVRWIEGGREEMGELIQFEQRREILRPPPRYSA